jgi:holo-[acyl-carrier protein] synthase
LPSGRPTLQLTGGAKQRLAALTPAGFEARIDLTMTDEGPTAHAFVVISAVPVPAPQGVVLRAGGRVKRPSARSA